MIAIAAGNVLIALPPARKEAVRPGNTATSSSGDSGARGRRAPIPTDF
ncbi:hypothetical protein [Microlunatus sp. GCM10028923]